MQHTIRHQYSVVLCSHVCLKENKYVEEESDLLFLTCTRLPFCIPLRSMSTLKEIHTSAGPPIIDVLASTVAAYEADSSNSRMVANGVYSGNLAMYNVENAIR